MPGGPAAASLFLVPSRSRWVADEVQLAHRTLDLQKMTQARTETGVDPKFLDRQYLDTEKVRRTEGHTRNRHQDSGRDCREAGMMDAGVPVTGGRPMELYERFSGAEWRMNISSFSPTLRSSPESKLNSPFYFGSYDSRHSNRQKYLEMRKRSAMECRRAETE